MGSVVRATLKKTNSSVCVFQRSNGFVARFFSTEAQQPPRDSTPPFLHTDNSGIPFLWFFFCILYVIHDLINEARTLIGLGVSQCWTRVGVWVGVWHDNDNYNYMELCNFLKLLLVSTCQCLDYVWCPCLWPCFIVWNGSWIDGLVFVKYHLFCLGLLLLLLWKEM
jgi:hypothetical protein